MHAFRRHLGRLAGTVLSLQICMMAAVPTILCDGVDITANAGVACTCAHGHGSCPMHHHTTSAQSPACSCRRAADPRTEMVATLLGPIAVLATPVHLEACQDAAERVALADSRPLDAVSNPDPPPPRT